MTYGTNESIILTDSTNNYVDYTLYNDSSNVFAGRAYKFPSSTYLTIDVTDICHDLVGPCFIDSATGHIDNSHALKSFTLYGTNTQNFSVRYWNRFDEACPQGNYLYNDPAGRTVDPGSWLMIYSTGVFYGYKNGTQVYSSSGGARKVELSSWSLNNGDKISISGSGKTINYRVKCGADYELFYQNSRGALDSIVFYGPCTMKSSATRYLIAKSGSYSPADNYEHKNQVEATEGKIGWNLNTGIMRDEESANIIEVILSNRCWLHDLSNDNLYAVNIVNSDIEQKLRKKDKNNTSYSLNVELARNYTSKN